MTQARRRCGSVLAAGVLLGSAHSASAEPVAVSTATALRAAMLAAAPGAVITVAAGTYAFDSAVWTGAPGTEAAPVTLTAAKTGDVKLEFSGTEEGIVIAHPYWVLEHIWVQGACSGGGCGDGAAGMHIKAAASRTVVRYSRVTNWGENIKSDRSATAEPTDCVLLGNEIYNDTLASGGTGIDLVGGLRWRIVGNFVHDYARNETHYGIFAKGGARDAVIEKNLVVGAHTLPAGSGAAVGISFGGGGTGSQYCAADNVGGGGCACEAVGGIARNNIVAHTTDAGLHTKRACGSVFAHNTVYDTGLGLQIQIVGAAEPVELHNSVLSLKVNGTATASDNLLNVSKADFAKLYANPDALDFHQGSDFSTLDGKAPLLAAVTDDYFGAARQAPADLGAIELPTAGSVFPWSETGAVPSGGSSGGGSSSGGGAPDAGAASSSSGSGAGGSSGTSGGTSSGGSAGAGGSEKSAGSDESGGCAVGRSSHPAVLLAGLGVLAASILRRRRARP